MSLNALHMTSGSWCFRPAHPTSRPWRQHRRGIAAVQARAQPGMRSFDLPAAGSQGSSPTATTTTTTTSSSSSASTSSAPAPAKRVQDPALSSPYRVSLWNALKFNGPAPEKVNGRLAMLAFLLAAKAELEGGGSILDQALHPSWAVLGAMALIVYGSLVPIQYGAIDEPFGAFTPAAERWNGRAAMLGFAGLAALEWYSGGVPFF